MINFKNREDQLPSILILVSMLLLAGTLIYMLFVPEPSAAGVAKGRQISKKQIEKEISDAKTQSQQMAAGVQPYLWQGSDDTITSQVLTMLTDQANQRLLKMAAFRPQKPQSLPGARELTYSVQVSGTYAVVHEMIKILDDPHSKLSLRSVQLASSDSNTSAVTATLFLSAYAESNEPAQPARPRPVTKTEPSNG